MLDVSQPAFHPIQHDDDNASSPALDSPHTPTNANDNPDVKIASHPEDHHDALAAPEPEPVKIPAQDAPAPVHHIYSPPKEDDVAMADGQSVQAHDEEAGAEEEEGINVEGQREGEEVDGREAEAEAGGEEADVEMAANADEVAANGDQASTPADAPHTNGIVNGDDAAPPSPADVAPPTLADVTEHGVPSSPAHNDTLRRDDADDVDQPPTKRARKFSDADIASAHLISPASLSNQASPPAVAAPPARMAIAEQQPALDPNRPTTFTASQHKFALSTVRTLKKLKDAIPFKLPVDPVALGIPHYFQVVKHPMDLTTIEHKLASSNPAKPDPNLNNPRYATADEFIEDVRLIFSNSVTFNGLDHPVTLMGKRVEEVFDKQIKHLPAPEEPRAEPVAAPSWARPTITSKPTKPAPIRRPATPPPPAAPSPVIPAPAPAAVSAPPSAKKAPPPRRPSTSVPVIRRNDAEGARPKREIHPPPTKELPYTNEPKKRRRVSKANVHTEQLKYCGKILDQLAKKQHYQTVLPFAEPVDWVKLQIPDYPKIVKKPMDLRTIREKLEAGEYTTPEKFRQDFQLIIKNCFAYNAPGTPVNQAGIELQHIFEEKWRGMPPERRQVESEDDEDDEDEEDESDAERAREIARIEAQIMSLRETVEVLKAKSSGRKTQVKEKKKKRAVPAPEHHVPASAPVASSSKPKKEARPPPPPKKKAGSKKAVIPDDDVLSFDQKKELSDAITTLDGEKLERVIAIIHEGVPEIRNSEEEIELEIDSLPAAVLTKLYNMVIRPMRPPPPKKARTGKGTGTGGLKRKSMDEDVEEAKIRKLEAQMRLFEDAEHGGGGGGGMSAHAELAANGGGREMSVSSSDDDSSGSDSE